MLNAPSVVAAMLAGLQLVLAAGVASASASALRALRRARTAHEQDDAEVGALRPALQAVALCVVVLASAPLLVGVLVSYVPQWEQVMCVAGVTRIGTASAGAARHLPALLDALFVTKPALVLLAGAWLASHAVLRRSAGRPGALGPGLLLALGLLAGADAGIELAYLLIPKQEVFLASGCCYSAPAIVSSDASWIERVWPDAAPAAVLSGLGVAAAALVGTLVVVVRSPTPGSRRLWATTAAAGGLVGLAAQHVAVALASPALLGSEAHRCGWCVIERSNLGGAAIGALVVSLSGLVLGIVAAALERTRPEAGARTSRALAKLSLAAFCLAAAFAAVAALA